MKQYYFTIKACDSLENDTLHGVTEIEVIDVSVDKALKQARNLIDKKVYIVTNIVEKSEKV
jgi:hypothetical protein